MSSLQIRPYMIRTLVLCLPVLLVAPSITSATPITVKGQLESSGAHATGALSVFGGTLILSITNTSALDIRITGVGFRLSSNGVVTNSVRGFSGSGEGQFSFSDSAGYVPQVGTRAQITSPLLDFGWLTGRSFASGRASRGLAVGETLNFVASGYFLGLRESDLASGLFVRFQTLDGLNDDVGTAQPTQIPEPASLLLVGSALVAVAARRRRRKA